MRKAPDELPAMVARLRPEMVGISSTFTADFPEGIAAARTVKQLSPQSLVFVGGHHASLRPSDFRDPAIDVIVVGEGEAATRDLVECRARGGDLAEIPGLILNRPQGQQRTTPRPMVGDLDDLPFPRRDVARSHGWEYSMSMAGGYASVETSRGCPYQCNFCSVWRFYEGKMRFKSPRRVLEELKQIEEPNVLFTDDNFLVDVPRAREIGRLIAENGIRKDYIIQARSDTITQHPEIVEQWKKLGLTMVFIGFEKPTQDGLQSVNKHNTVQNNERALEVMRSFGIEPVTMFIVDPDYSREDFAGLRAYIRRLRLTQPGFAILTPLPGTELFDEREDQLTCRDYSAWDLGHVVLPTRLPLDEFCREMASLYRTAYPRWKLAVGDLYLRYKGLRSADEGIRQMRGMLATVRQLQSPHGYLPGPHQAASAGKLRRSPRGKATASAARQ